MQIQGVLLQTTGIEQITDAFKKTNLIIQTEHDTQYPQEVSIEVHNDNIAKLSSCGAKAGDIVTVDCNLRGRKYEKEGQPAKWFNTIVLWKITKVSDGVAPAAVVPPSQGAAAPGVVNEEDDLPF
jgi:selenophosphate synthetase-related protein